MTMKLRDMLTAIREYPNIHADMEVLKSRLERTQQELQKSELECERLNYEGENQQYQLGHAQRRAEALTAALCTFCPMLSTANEMQKFYECVAPHMDADGFKLYFTAEQMTGFKSYDAFPYEDARGQFEEADGNQLMGYLIAYRFGAVDWDIVPGTCYERATLTEVDTATPEYQAFQKELYEKTLRKMGFDDLLPPEPEKEKERQHAPERGSEPDGR